MKYLVEKECYYGEAGARPRHMKAGTVYESKTLSPDKAPSYFKLLDAPKAAAVANKPAEPAKASLGMSYNEMKKFVKDNDIEVADNKQPTLEAAISKFQADLQYRKEIEAKGEADAEKVADDLKAGKATEANDPEAPMTQSEE